MAALLVSFCFVAWIWNSLLSSPSGTVYTAFNGKLRMLLVYEPLPPAKPPVAPTILSSTGAFSGEAPNTAVGKC